MTKERERTTAGASFEVASEDAIQAYVDETAFDATWDTPPTEPQTQEESVGRDAGRVADLNGKIGFPTIFFFYNDTESKLKMRVKDS